MDRLFLDANVLFSAAYREDSGLLALWGLADAKLLSSIYALEEARLNLSDVGQRERLAELRKHVDLVAAGTGTLPKGVSLPDKDIPILLAAIGARATHLLTGDVRHFGAYFDRTIEGVLVSLPGPYLLGRHKKRRVGRSGA